MKAEDRLRLALEQLIKAARPFIDSGIVDETSGTIPLMDTLRDAIADAERLLNENNESRR